MAHSEFPELFELQRVIEQAPPMCETRVVGEVDVQSGQGFPLYAITLGNPAPELPAIGFFGGVHGLERIGAAVVIAYLHHLVKRLEWDATLHRQLESVRLVFMPLVNPGGMALGTRANPNGVDLMRNAPIDADERVPALVGGQRISARLPWYRGARGAGMERESEVLCALVEAELSSRDFSLAVDCHSGFGVNDRIWFPYAHTRKPFEHLAEVHALNEVFNRTHSNHTYVFEPQSRQYLAHGDLWDYLHLRACQQAGRIMLPLTLEMGSWLWVKKNPRQLFTRRGIFNPQIEHRLQRVLRRHLSLLDFLSRAACSYRNWLPQGEGRVRHRHEALVQWYPDLAGKK